MLLSMLLLLFLLMLLLLWPVAFFCCCCRYWCSCWICLLLILWNKNKQTNKQRISVDARRSRAQRHKQNMYNHMWLFLYFILYPKKLLFIGCNFTKKIIVGFHCFKQKTMTEVRNPRLPKSASPNTSPHSRSTSGTAKQIKQYEPRVFSNYLHYGLGIKILLLPVNIF